MSDHQDLTLSIIWLLNPLPTSPVAATGLCKDAADWASRQRVNARLPI